MFNKNDPLIGAVQQVMQKSNAERDAVKAVNEKFGIVDRKALPREKQGEWDAAYKQIISEELKGNQHKIDANKNNKVDAHDFKLLRKKKTMQEETPDPIGKNENEGGSAVTTVAPKKEKSVTSADQSALKKKIQSIKEARLDEKAPPGAKYERMVKHIKDKLGKDGLTKNEKSIAYATAWKAKKKNVNEGFNDRHNLSVTASVEEQVVAEANNVLNDKSKFNPRSQAARIRYQGALASKKVKPFKPAATDRLTPEPGNYTVNKIKDKAETFARAATGDLGDVVGLTDPKRGEGLRKFNPGAAQAGDLAAAATTVGLPGRNVLKTGKVASVTKPVAAAEKPVAATASVVKQTTSVADKFKTNYANKRFNVAGAEPKAAPAPKTTQSGVPSVARTPGNKIGIGGKQSAVEKTGPWNKTGPNAPARPAAAAASTASKAVPNAASRINAIRRVASDKPLQAATAAGVAGGIALATKPANAPSPAAAATQQAAKIGGQTGGVNKPAATNAPASKPVAAKPVAAKPVAAKPVVAKPVAPKVGLQSKTQRDNTISSSGKSTAGPGGVTSGTKTGTTITNKPVATKKAPVGTGRVK